MNMHERFEDAARAAAGHIAVCVPCVDRPNLMFTYSLAAMYYQMGRAAAPMCMITSGGSVITNARNKCIEQIELIEKQGALVEWVFFVDSDMKFPDKTLLRLLNHGKSIVGCTYLRRTPPYDMHGHTLDGKPRDFSKDGLVEVAALPTGCLLIHRSVFTRMKRPYFRLVVDEEKEITYGEDYVFCATARALGYKIYLDAEWSKQIGHAAEKFIYPDGDKWHLTVNEAETPEGLQAQIIELQERLLKKAVSA